MAREQNKEIVGGTCHSVGIVGWTLGAGRGFTSPKFGLGVDQLLEVSLVNAEGEFVTASHSENPKLFYAIRGGGGGFGVIYNLKIKLHDETCKTNMTGCYQYNNVLWKGKYSSSKIDYIKNITRVRKFTSHL